MSQSGNRARARRPLAARSVVASVLLGTRGGALSGQRLVRTAELFGFAEGTTRVALSRMVAAGELDTRDGRYRLAGSLLDRQGRQESGRRPRLRAWTGAWRVGVVEASQGRPAADRAELRKSLIGQRLAEWREGVWLRPDNLVDAPSHPACAWLTARLDEPRSATDLAGCLWDLDGWAASARGLLNELRSSVGDLEAGRTGMLADGFVIAAAAVRHLAADPLLPADLLPARWPGDELRAEYDRYEAAYQGQLGSWLRGADR
jgi:phenylacetic acid degradation operon negative regulatory protein